MALDDIIKEGKKALQFEAMLEEFNKIPRISYFPLLPLLDGIKGTTRAKDIEESTGKKIEDLFNSTHNYQFLQTDQKDARNAAIKSLNDFGFPAAVAQLGTAEKGMVEITRLLVNIGPIENDKSQFNDIAAAHKKAYESIRKEIDSTEDNSHSKLDDLTQKYKNDGAGMLALAILTRTGAFTVDNSYESKAKRAQSLARQAQEELFEAFNKPEKARDYLAYLYNNADENKKSEIAYNIVLRLAQMSDKNGNGKK